MQDVHLIEKLAHFDRERIPERVVHAKGAGAHGYFQVFKSMAKYTCAKLLQDPKKKTPVFVRFSTVVGARGSAETVRDPRGFAVKFYTEDGNYDLVGNNLPVFFIRDAIKFPDMVHAFKPAPDTNIPTSSSANSRFWDFISLSPESTHMITWLFSDRGTVRSFRKMEGFGVNTYVWVNAEGKTVYVKYHWKPNDGIETIDRQEATRLAGEDPDIATRDLYDTIASGKTVGFELHVQIMEIADELKQNFDPLDATKTWPEDKFPLMPVGKMVLNRNAENYFAEVEQAAFCPASIIPGIDFSADKLLQGRIFSYADTQRYRLGPNYLQIPINQQGYRRSSMSPSTDEKKCKKECSREPWSSKKSRIFNEKLSYNSHSEGLVDCKCESWEKSVMDQRLLKKIRFEEYPILFLLIFCDTVQDEGRIASSDEVVKDLSSLEDIYVKSANGKNSVLVNLTSSAIKAIEKEQEIQRMAWCLKDERFKVRINEKLKVMNGSGGE